MSKKELLPTHNFTSMRHEIIIFLEYNPMLPCGDCIDQDQDKIKFTILFSKMLILFIWLR